MQIFKVYSTTKVQNLGLALNDGLLNDHELILEVADAQAINIAIKASILLRGNLCLQHKDLVLTPSYTSFIDPKDKLPKSVIHLHLKVVV